MGRKSPALLALAMVACGPSAVRSTARSPGDAYVLTSPPARDAFGGVDALSEEDGVCVTGAWPPAPDAYVADVPAPQAPQCPHVPPLATIQGQPAPPGVTLELVLPAFATPTEPSPWLEIRQGAQGLAHVHAGFRMQLPTGPLERTVKLRGVLCSEGNVLAAGDASVQVTRQPDGSYLDARADAAGVRMVIPGNPSTAAHFCGHWAQVHLQAFDPASGRAGEADALVRLYFDDFRPGEP